MSNCSFVDTLAPQQQTGALSVFRQIVRPEFCLCRCERHNPPPPCAVRHRCCRLNRLGLRLGFLVTVLLVLVIVVAAAASGSRCRTVRGAHNNRR